MALGWATLAIDFGEMFPSRFGHHVLVRFILGVPQQNEENSSFLKHLGGTVRSKVLQLNGWCFSKPTRVDLQLEVSSTFTTAAYTANALFGLIAVLPQAHFFFSNDFFLSFYSMNQFHS